MIAPLLVPQPSLPPPSGPPFTLLVGPGGARAHRRAREYRRSARRESTPFPRPPRPSRTRTRQPPTTMLVARLSPRPRPRPKHIAESTSATSLPPPPPTRVSPFVAFWLFYDRTFATCAETSCIHCTPPLLFLLFRFFSRGPTPVYLYLLARLCLRSFAALPALPHFSTPSASRSPVAIERERVGVSKDNKITIIDEEEGRESLSTISRTERPKGTERGREGGKRGRGRDSADSSSARLFTHLQNLHAVLHDVV